MKLVDKEAVLMSAMALIMIAIIAIGTTRFMAEQKPRERTMATVTTKTSHNTTGDSATTSTITTTNTTRLVMPDITNDVEREQ